jgi:hypothetical protein
MNNQALHYGLGIESTESLARLAEALARLEQRPGTAEPRGFRSLIGRVWVKRHSAAVRIAGFFAGARGDANAGRG